MPEITLCGLICECVDDLLGDRSTVYGCGLLCECVDDLLGDRSTAYGCGDCIRGVVAPGASSANEGTGGGEPSGGVSIRGMAPCRDQRREPDAEPLVSETKEDEEEDQEGTRGLRSVTSRVE